MANEHKVAYHKWYIVSGPVGGKVTNAAGTVTYCTIPEGGQGCFYAVTTKVYTDNAAVQVDEIVNFNGALVASAGSGSAGVSEEDVASIVGSQFKLAVGSNVPTASADNFSIALGGSAKSGGIAVGYKSKANNSNNGIAIGRDASTSGFYGISIGSNTNSASGVSIGPNSYTSSGISIGSGANTPSGISIGSSANSDGISIGDSSYNNSYFSIAIGYKANCSHEGQIAFGHMASASNGHTMAFGSEAKAGFSYSTAIGERTSTYEQSSLILSARSAEQGCELTLELLAKDILATGGDGAIGEDGAFIVGFGVLRFGVRDLVSGERETMTIDLYSLWEMLRAAGGVSEKKAVSEYYY